MDIEQLKHEVLEADDNGAGLDEHMDCKTRFAIARARADLRQPSGVRHVNYSGKLRAFLESDD